MHRVYPRLAPLAYPNFFGYIITYQGIGNNYFCSLQNRYAKTADKSTMSREDKRFVIQQHTTGRDVHWDFMLELGDILQTYRLDKAPQQIIHSPANAVKIFNHPLKFLAYQGPVNKGRGSVRLTESGTYKIVHQARNRIKLDLSGKILKGKFTLTHIEGNNWQFRPDSSNFGGE